MAARVGSLLNGLRIDDQERQESASPAAKVALGVLCLVAAFAYRGSVSLIPWGILEDGFLIGLAALFLAIALLLRRSDTVGRYWQVPFAFFVFTLAGFAGDVNISPIQRAFITDALHQAATADNPLASNVLGTVVVQLFSTLCIVLPIVILVRASGGDLGSLFIRRPKSWPFVLIGFLGLLAFYYLAARGRTAAFSPSTR